MYLKNGTLLQNGKYRIDEFIGSGGFGCTYKATHTALRRTVAVKEFFVKDFCNRDTDSSYVKIGIENRAALVSKLKNKFIEEASAQKSLQHPNIVSVYEIFEENGSAYFVMDYIDGESLSDIVKRRGSLPEDEAVTYIKQVCNALSCVHSHSLLHLDVKPGNIMIGKDGKALLIDFGASKQYNEENGENTSTLIGKTPGYAPIEQFGNSVQNFTPATDIYSLGATLYKCLTGDTPPEATTIVSEGLQPLPKSVSPAVRKAVMKAMNINKRRRPQSVEEFVGLLNQKDEKAENENTITEISATPKTAPKKKRDLVIWAAGAIMTLIAILLIYNRQGETQTEQSTQPQQNSVEEIPQRQEAPASALSDSETKGYMNGYEWADLGLPSGTRWATYNIGANNPQSVGTYFAWGDLFSKNSYSPENSETYRQKIADFSGSDANDAARKSWGEPWQMPTKEDIEELIKHCKWTRTAVGARQGWLVTGTNGNNIFLPFSGLNRYEVGVTGFNSTGFYWTSTPYTKEGETMAYYIDLTQDKYARHAAQRWFGQQIRAVFKPKLP